MPNLSQKPDAIRRRKLAMREHDRFMAEQRRIVANPRNHRPATAENVERVLKMFGEGASMRQACKAVGVCRHNITAAILEADALDARFARAMRQRVAKMAIELDEIADRDDLTPDDRRIRIDTRKWLLSRLLREYFGDSLEVNVKSQGLVMHVHAPAPGGMLVQAEAQEAQPALDAAPALPLRTDS